ncbi:MAG: ABC transporter permease [Alphaproteobacteria bacterium]|nr:ABC transporter permease [Alphaproteobacteria bacterium]
MFRLAVDIAFRHLVAHPRQTIALLLGTVIGVSMFLTISALTRGSEGEFIRRLVDSAPHITISDEFRRPRVQPADLAHPAGAVEVRHVKPVTETRGIRGYAQVLDFVRRQPGVKATAVLVGQALITFAGKEFAVALNGITPKEFEAISIVGEDMKQGSLDALAANPNGIVIGAELAKTLSLHLGNAVNVVATNGQVRTFRIVGVFRTGQVNYDTSQTFVQIKRVQALMNRPSRANSIVVQLDDPMQARTIAERIEAQIGYKSLSWQEMSENLLATLATRNVASYTIISAVLLVAAFGIYNLLSTVVGEKQRDIAILKAMGFLGRDLELAFVLEGLLLGLAGVAFGIPLGMFFMYLLGDLKLTVPGMGDEPISIPLDWGLDQFLLAGGFALVASLAAAYLPARRAARVEPVAILRGAV